MVGFFFFRGMCVFVSVHLVIVKATNYRYLIELSSIRSQHKYEYTARNNGGVVAVGGDIEKGWFGGWLSGSVGGLVVTVNMTQ